MVQTPHRQPPSVLQRVSALYVEFKQWIALTLQLMSNDIKQQMQRRQRFSTSSLPLPLWTSGSTSRHIFEIVTLILSGMAAMICSASVSTRTSCSPETHQFTCVIYLQPTGRENHFDVQVKLEMRNLSITQPWALCTF